MTIQNEEDKIMSYTIDKAKLGDEGILAYIQTESWKSAFQDIIDREMLENCTNLEKVTAMYKRILEQNIGNGYILKIDGNPHCIAWWSATRTKDMPDYAELICIHSLPSNWHKGYGSKMIHKVLADISSSGYSKVMLWVFKENERARKFYESIGFYTTGRAQTAWNATEIAYEYLF
jgi:ribosomal protein S18 acetylase RimI-like enzyme